MAQHLYGIEYDPEIWELLFSLTAIESSLISHANTTPGDPVNERLEQVQFEISEIIGPE